MPNTPKQKPYTEEKFKQDADKFIKGYLGGFDQGEMNQFLKRSVDKIENSGVMSSDEAKDFIKERAYYLREFAKDNPGKTLPELKANGGRIGFLKGGDTKYNAMVFRMYTEAGGQEGTGMDIDTFAEKYFPKMAQGGRIGFDDGGTHADDDGTLPIKQKTKTGPIKGGKTPQLLPEEFEKYQKMIKKKQGRDYAATGGRIGFQEGSLDPDTLALSERVKEIMDAGDVDFGIAFKQALRELIAESKD